MNIRIESKNFHWWRFSHYKAQSCSKTLTALQVKKINLTLRIDLPLERWLHGILVLLEKESGNIDIDKVQTIILFKADFNWLLKIIGDKNMWHKSHRCLNQECSASFSSES